MTEQRREDSRGIMTEKSSTTAIDPSASPLATVQDIQRRLLRPSSQSVHHRAPIISSTSEIYSDDHSQIKEKSSNQQQQIGGRGREIGKDKKLCDYLDPYLLYLTASKISHANVTRTNLKSDSVIDSEFPAVGFGLTSFGGERRNSKKRRIEGNDKDVDLHH